MLSSISSFFFFIFIFFYFLYFFFFLFFILFFFFKQKTAYEIYQCDWSSDVCSSDLYTKQVNIFVIKAGNCSIDRILLAIGNHCRQKQKKKQNLFHD